MVIIINTIIEADESINHVNTSRWNRKYNDKSELFYHRTITAWKTRDITIEKLLDRGDIIETEKNYKIINPITLNEKIIFLDKTLKFVDNIKCKINNCKIIIKKSGGYTALLVPVNNKK